MIALTRPAPVAVLASAVAVLVAALPARAQEAPLRPPDVRFHEAWYREVAEGRLDEALDAYRELTGNAAAPAALRARALFRAGVCLEKLGRKDEARAAHERVLAEFPGDEEAAQAARRALEGESAAGAAFRDKVEGLVARLGEGPYEEERRDGGRRYTVTHPAAASLAEIGPATAPYLLAALGSGNYYACESAARLLVRFAEEDRSLTERVLAALRSGDEIVRKAVIEALAQARAGSAAWTDALAGLLDDPAPEVRAAAVGILGGPRYQRADALLRAVADRDPSVREAAAAALAGLPPPKRVEVGVAPLLPLLEDPSPAVVASAIAAIFIKPFALPRGEAGERTLELLVAVAGREDLPAHTRALALSLLGDTGRPEAGPQLLGALRSRDEEVVLAAVEALGALGERAAAAALLDVLTASESARVRDAALKPLSTTFAGPSTIKALIDRLPRLGERAADVLGLFDWDQRRDLAVACLGHYGELDARARRAMLDNVNRLMHRGFPEAHAVILAGLEDPNAAVRGEAVKAASYLRDPAAVPLLIRLLGDSDAGIRGGACGALGDFRDAAVSRALVAALADRDNNVAAAANRSLKRIGDAAVVPDLLALLASGSDTAHPDWAEDALSHLARVEDAPAVAAALEGMLPGARRSALGLLGGLGNAAVVPAVRRWLDDGDPRVARAAVEALDLLGGDDAIAGLAGALGRPETEVRRAAAGALLRRPPERLREAPALLERLAACLEDRSWDTRLAAVKALGHLGDPRAAPALVEAMREGDSREYRKSGDQPGKRGRPARRLVTGGPDELPPPEESVPGSIAQEATAVLLELTDRSVVPPVLELLAGIEAAVEKNPWLGVGSPLALIERHATAAEAPAIAASLERQKPEVRRELVRILGALGNPETLPAVRAALADADDLVRASAAGALGALGGNEAFAALLAAFSEEREEEPLEAILEALASFRRPEAIPALLANVRDEERAVRGAGHYGALWRLRELPEERALAALASVLEGEFQEAAKVDAVEVLRAIHGARAHELIARAAAAAEGDVRVEAIQALAAFMDPADLPRLVELLRDRDGSVRAAARTSIESIRFYLDQRRFAAGGAVGAAGDALRELLGLLASGDAPVRLAAVRSLARLRPADPEALAALVRLRKDADAAVRAAVDEALDALAGKGE